MNKETLIKILTEYNKKKTYDATEWVHRDKTNKYKDAFRAKGDKK